LTALVAVLHKPAPKPYLGDAAAGDSGFLTPPIRSVR